MISRELCERVLHRAMSTGADFAELFAEHTNGHSISMVDSRVESINDMSIKISQSEKAQTEFVSSVSHELRTPLTAITGWAETLEYDPELDEDARRGIGIILKVARRLTGMVEELLEFTRLQDGRFTLNVEETDVEAVLEDVIFTYTELLRQEGMLL